MSQNTCTRSLASTYFANTVISKYKLLKMGKKDIFSIKLNRENKLFDRKIIFIYTNS